MGLSITQQIVSDWVRGNLFETLQTDTEASDAVQIIETIIAMMDDEKTYWQMFCEKHDMLVLLEDEDSKKAWKQDLKAVYEVQLEWLEHTVGELRRAAKGLFS